MKKLLSLWMFLPIFLVLAACSDNSEDIDRYYATVSTPKVTTTTPTSLTVTASVTGDLNQIVKKGFCYSTAKFSEKVRCYHLQGSEGDRERRTAVPVPGVRPQRCSGTGRGAGRVR